MKGSKQKPQAMSQSDDQVSSPTLANCAYAAIAGYFQKTVEYEVEVLRDQDPEPLHQMRVGMRRLRTILQVFAPILNLPKAASMQRIGKIAHTLGEVRDLDVLQIELQTIYYPHLQGKEKKHLKMVLKQLAKTRCRAFADVQTMMTQPLYQNFKNAYQAWLKQPSYCTVGDPDAQISFGELPVTFCAPDLLLPLFSQLLLHQGWLVGTKIVNQQLEPIAVDVSFLERHKILLHDLRKQIKRVRYQTDCFKQFYGNNYAAQAKNLQNAQEILGQIQDNNVLCDFLAHVLGAEVSDVLPTLDQQVREKQALIWQNWQVIQKQYLDPKFRNSLRQVMSNG